MSTAKDRQFALYYMLVAGLALGFQISVRAEQCAGTIPCLVSYAKGVVWSIMWPLFWVAHFAGIRSL
jgi:hypothetical protein